MSLGMINAFLSKSVVKIQ